MSFKVNPLSFRSNKKIQNFFFNARFNKLPSGVFIENYIKSLLYAKDLYLINCQIVEKTEKNFIIFFSYYPFFKQYIHETVLFSKFKFSNKFTFFKKSLKNKRKSQKKDISFNYSKYFKKYQLKKKKIFLRKVVLVSYFRKLFNNKVIKLKQNVKECGGYFAIERFITFQNNMSKIINKKLVGFNIVFNGLLLMIYGFSFIFNSAINSKGVLINMFVGNIIAAALDITYLVDREFTLDYVTLSKDDLPVLAKTDALNYLTDAHKNTEFRIGSNDIIDRFIMNILFTKNRRYNRVKALFR